jgi:phosphoglycerate kinase
MEEWFKDWFDADYTALYAHRDEREAALAVGTLLAAEPGFARGPVLDLGCGSGRHLAELRKTNPQAFGLDLSPHLLGLAPASLRGWLLRGDMRHLPLRPGTLAGVCLWFTPFGYFSDGENEALLRTLQRLLRPDGALLLDLMNAYRLKVSLVGEDTLERGGVKVHSRRSLEAGRVVKRMAIERTGSGAVRKAVESVRIYEPDEIRRIAHACGFTLKQELGDYGGSPFRTADSPRWIGLFVKNSTAGQRPRMEENGAEPIGRCRMSFRSIEEMDVNGHRVFLRADLNVPVKDGVVKDPTRIRETLPTLKYLLDHGASVVLASHLGRPQGTGFEEAFSLAPVATWMKGQGFDVTLASGVVGERIVKLAEVLEPGQILLLENLRFDKGETKNREDFCKALARMADTYVNDAFGSAHRAHASVSGMVPYFKPDRIAAGFLMTKELKAMQRVMGNPKKPLVAVMGGAKVSDKIELISHFLGKADAILIGGAMSFTFLKAKGVQIGKSLHEDDKLELALKLIQEAKDKGTRLLLPVDHIVASEISPDAECAITDGDAIPEDKMGLDIGPETVATYLQEIRGASTILWNGPMGVFEVEAFAAGTLSLAEEMAEAADRGAFVLLGGGDSVAAANKAGVVARMSHASTGGGASLEYLSGLELPGVTALLAKP